MTSHTQISFIFSTSKL